MPRYFNLEVQKDQLTINEVQEDGEYIDTVHRTDVVRFCDQNNVTLTRVEQKHGTFKDMQIVVEDGDILETYLIEVEICKDGSVKKITYG